MVDLARLVIDHLRRSPGTRSVVYLVGAASLLEVVGRTYDISHPNAVIRVHLTIFPFGTAWTEACICLRPEDRARWHRIPLRSDGMQALQGIGLGAGAFLVLIGAAAAKGW